MSPSAVPLAPGAAWGQSGYVFEPWQSYEVTGWRKSDAQVAAFEFTALPDSYAARTGRPLDVGVIGVAVFRERPPAPVVLHEPASIAPPPPLASLPAPAPARESAPTQARAADAQEKAAADTAGAAAQSAPLARKRLGTGHGEREESWVSTTTFERAAATPDETVAIQYDRLDNLVAAGIVAATTAATVPRAFPGSPGSIGFVPDPPRR